MSKCFDCNKQLIKKRKGGHICDESYDKFWKVTQPIGYELGRLATIKEILLLLSALEEELPKTYRMIKLTYEKELLGA